MELDLKIILLREGYGTACAKYRRCLGFVLYSSEMCYKNIGNLSNSIYEITLTKGQSAQGSAAFIKEERLGNLYEGLLEKNAGEKKSCS